MAVNNKLRVQGRTPRNDITEHYKGEKLNINDSKYILNDVVSIKNANDNITFEKYNGTSFEPYYDFQLNILDKSFSSESVYYYTLNNAFNTCRIITYNLMNLLKGYSSVNNITLNKDTSINEMNICISNSLENFIQFYFYNKYGLFGISFTSIVNSLAINFKYFYKQSMSSSLTQERGLLTFKIIDDDSLYFDYLDKSLKHYNRIECNNNYYQDKEGWDQIGEFYNYSLDKEGHIQSYSPKNIILPKRPYLKSEIIYNGDKSISNDTKILEGERVDNLKNFNFLELIFSTEKKNEGGLQESVFIDTYFISKNNGVTVKFPNISISTEIKSEGTSYSYNVEYATIRCSQLIREIISLNEDTPYSPNIMTEYYNRIHYIIGYKLSF